MLSIFLAVSDGVVLQFNRALSMCLVHSLVNPALLSLLGLNTQPAGSPTSSLEEAPAPLEHRLSYHP